MPELIKLIGIGIYEEKKDTLSEESEPEENDLNVWEVTYTWKANISAETEEDAIAIGRHERSTYYAKGSSEEYTAKRAEFISPVGEGNREYLYPSR